VILEAQIAAFRRWWDILSKEGLFTSTKRTFSFLLRSLYRRENMYLYYTSVEEEASQPYCMPKTADFELKIITETAQADKLIANGFQFDSYLLTNDKRLQCGAIAFCVFVEKQLAYISWLATDKKAKDAIADVPRPVDFTAREAYAGWTFRNPKYWRLSSGLSSFVHYKRALYLQHKGFKTYKYEVNKNNRVMLNMTAKRSQAKLYRQARYIKFLWCKSWRESDL
jgi:hypothetical protein